MGKIILCPPPYNSTEYTNTPTVTASPYYNNQFTSNQLGQFTINPSVLNTPTSGTTFRSFDSTKFFFPQPLSVTHDPLHVYSSYFGFPKTHNYAQKTRRKKNHACETFTIPGYNIAKIFWDHKDIEDSVASLSGDVILQIDNHLGSNYWNFFATEGNDFELLRTICENFKNHRFVIDTYFGEEIQKWLDKFATEFDFFNSSAFGEENEIFIRDELEAAHFKLTWLGRPIDV